MGSGLCREHSMMVSQPTHYPSNVSKQVKSGRINVRLLMNPEDSGDNRRPQQMYQSISHFRETPTQTLEQSCQRLQIKDLPSCIAKAKNYSTYPKKKELKHDEQAAINLYTQQNQFYKQLNDALRRNDERALMPWYGYLKLFLTALNKLNPYQGTVWRGVTKDLSTKYNKNDEHVWWAFSSCTSSMDILESPNFLGATEARTLFSIEVFNGRLISEFSEFATEDEILLLPGTRVRVISVLKQPTGLHIIHLKQIEPSYSLFESSESSVVPFQPVSYNQPQDDYISETSSQDYAPNKDYYEPQSIPNSDALSAFSIQIQLAKGISSDSEKAKVLKHLLGNKHLTDQMIASVAECAKTISAAGDKAGVLKHLLGNKHLTDQMIVSVAECAKTISGAEEKADVLKLIAKRSGLSDQQFRVGVAAINSIRFDDDKADTLKTFLVHEQFSAQHLDVVLSATETMCASAEKASVFLQLIRNRYLNAKHFPSVLNGIKGIRHDDDKSDVLCKLAPRLPKNDANVREAYLTAANSITSSKDKAAAAMAFM